MSVSLVAKFVTSAFRTSNNAKNSVLKLERCFTSHSTDEGTNISTKNSINNESTQTDNTAITDSSSSTSDGLSSVCINQLSVADDVRLSDPCVQRLLQLCPAEQPVKQLVRLSVEGGGCSGFQYIFSLSSSADAGEDVRVSRDGAHLLVDRVSLEYVRGATVDFSRELIRAAFRVLDNPQSEQGCSCGASFSIKID